MKIKIIKHNWKIIIRSDNAHNARHPGTHAVAILYDRKIHIRKSSLTKVTIIHELIHAYQHELSFYELQLDEDQTEEWFAELIAKYGEEIFKFSNSVLAYYR